jgi:recombination protein U
MNDLENRIKKANLKYRKARKAVIQKLEVPVRMTTHGLVATLSTVDFYGVYLSALSKNKKKKVGVPIAFEAKETESKTSFPLVNIHQHQLEYLKIWNDVGGTGFFLIHFKNVHEDQAFVTPVELVDKYWQDPDGRKSIPLADFDPAWLLDIDDYLTYFTK